MNAEKAAPLMRRGGDVIVFVSFNVLIFFFPWFGFCSRRKKC